MISTCFDILPSLGFQALYYKTKQTGNMYLVATMERAKAAEHGKFNF